MQMRASGNSAVICQVTDKEKVTYWWDKKFSLYLSSLWSLEIVAIVSKIHVLYVPCIQNYKYN